MTKPTRPVAFLMGSDSDLPSLEGAFEILDELGVGYHVRVLSAHRTPSEVQAFVRDAKPNGIQVLIGAAGMAAHLAGTLASLTRLPVIGIPIDSGPYQGHDALLATVMMPPGVPVGTVGIGKSGAKNAALFAARILALADAALAQRLEERSERDRATVLKKDAVVRARFSC